MRKKQVISNAVLYLFLIAVLIGTMFPLLYTVLASFKSNAEILTNPGSMLPKNPTVNNYVQAWTSESFHVPTLLRNSVIYTLGQHVYNTVDFVHGRICICEGTF